jgi:HD-GYP domain-containing protein (c-di-GMP phosphodiesterase class II)
MLDIYNITDNSNELNVKEIIEIKKHPGKGSDLLAQMEIKTIINENIHIAAIHQHHERIDGSGYPRGLKNGEIDEFARIIGIVDVYEALTHKRKHRDSMISTEAIGAIVRTGDNKFGPDIVKALIEELSFYPIGSFVRMVTGEIGRVIKINKNMSTRPVIKLMFDRDSNKLTGREIDLSQDTKYAIKSAIDERKFNFLKEIDNVQVQKY